MRKSDRRKHNMQKWRTLRQTAKEKILRIAFFAAT